MTTKPEKSVEEIAEKLISYSSFEGTAPIDKRILKSELAEILTSERLRAEEAESEVNRLCDTRNHAKYIHEQILKIDLLEAELDEMALALKPFAEQAEKNSHIRILDDPKSVGYDHCLQGNTCKEYPCAFVKAKEALTRYHARKGGKV